ncbi:hypothetical protein C8R45DRAFT_1090727 [Mycena sanguinolenta]|nr:hypothetical protein C8R45DRAFT_1090727 [Mycena sanguinolenta]
MQPSEVCAQIVWILLASFGEVISFTIILGYLVVYRLVPEDTPTSYPSTSSHRPGSTILRFRNIILRIGLYPLVSCILNISTAVIEFCLFQNHQKNLKTLEQQLGLHAVPVAATAVVLTGEQWARTVT